MRKDNVFFLNAFRYLTKKNWKALFVAVFCLAFVSVFFGGIQVTPAHATVAHDAHAIAVDFPPNLQSYNDANKDILSRLQHRIGVNPFNLVGTIIFFFAIIHTFLATKLIAISHRWGQQHEEKKKQGLVPRNSVSHGARLLNFFGQVEVVFGLWAIALLMAIAILFDWNTAVFYITRKVNFTEAMFVVVIMTLASTRPIIKLSELMMDKVASLLGGSLSAWWLSILTLGPLLGSLITEPAAMTISALLLVRKFYELEPSTQFKYATLGLLFVNVSVGGTLTNFTAPPILMVAEPWGWGTDFMFSHFGLKAVAGIVLSNVLYWLYFRSELVELREKFAIRSLKEKILIEHLSREEMENALDSIVAEVREKLDFETNIRSLVQGLTSEVAERLKERYIKSIKEAGIDQKLAEIAFHKRLDELKLYRFRRTIPYLLPDEERAPFQDPNWDSREDRVPAWMMMVHVVFMGVVILNAHYPALFIPVMLFFLGFAVVTADFQNKIDLQPALLVGFFLGGLVVHGGVQGWWIEPLLGGLSELQLMLAAATLSAFNDNAALTYLCTLVPNFSDGLKYAVVAGAVTGGGLTVIANAPNPAGQTILKNHFEHGVSPLGLLKGAFIPTVIMFLMFFLL